MNHVLLLFLVCGACEPLEECDSNVTQIKGQGRDSQICAKWWPSDIDTLYTLLEKNGWLEIHHWFINEM
jgi:hypothetical protein